MSAKYRVGLLAVAGMLGCSGGTRTPLVDAGVGQLEVAPLSLGFGAVNVGSQVDQTLTATNTGSFPLTFTLSVVGNAQALYSVSPTGPLTLVAGDALSIVVTYAPPQPSSADSASLVFSWGTSGSIEVALTGSGLAPPCNYIVTPPALDFGEVRPGTNQVSSFTIEDTGPTDCWITDLMLGADTQAAFTLPEGPLASQRLSAPGSGEPFPSSLLVNVAFAPLQTGSYSGAVQFVVSDPTAPDQTVQLSGLGASSCLLVHPAELEFGTVGVSNGPFCVNGKKKFVVVNGCGSDGTITSVDLVDGGPFFLLDTPTLPAVVSSGGTSTPFVVGFKPTAVGTFYASILIYTDAQVQPYGVGLSGSAAGGSVQKDSFTQTFTFGPMSSYTFSLGEPGPGTTIEVTDVSVNDYSLPALDWSYDAVTNTVTIDEKFVTLMSGDVISIATTSTYELTPGLPPTCN